MIREMLLISKFHAFFGKACSALKVAWDLQSTIVVYQDNLTKNSQNQLCRQLLKQHTFNKNNLRN